MRICGVDASTKTIATVLFENGELSDWYLITTEKGKLIEERIFDLYFGFQDVIIERYSKPDLVVFEEVPWVINFKATRSLIEIVGNAKLICRLNNIKFVSVNNATWKKDIVGKGNADKNQIKEYIINRYPQLKDECQDIHDACCVGLWGVIKGVQSMRVTLWN